MHRRAIAIGLGLFVSASVARAQSAAPTAASIAPASSPPEPSGEPVTTSLASTAPTDANLIAPIRIALAPPRVPTFRVQILSPSIQQHVGFDASTLGRVQPGPSYQCTTPCALEMEAGDYVVYTRVPGGEGGLTQISVNDRVRRIFFRPVRGRAPALVATVGGGLTAITGLTLLAVILAGTCSSCPPVDPQPAVVGGLSLFVVGAAVVGIGAWAFTRSRRIVDHVDEQADEPLPSSPSSASPPRDAPPQAPATPRHERENRAGSL